MTGTYLVTRAMRKLNALNPGSGPTPWELQAGIDTLNHLVDSWALDKRMIWAASIFRQLFPSSKVSYTVGSGGDFNTTRPVRILEANMVFNQGANEVHIPCTPLQRREWLGIPVQLVATSIPVRFYYDRGFVSTPGTNGALASAGLGTIYFNPYPSAPLPDLEFSALVQITQFDLTTDYAFPPGYAKAIEYSLAEEMVEFQTDQSLNTKISAIAAEARAMIGTNNSEPPHSTSDIGLGRGNRGRADFNWETGNLQ